jgi:hypothetical protein
MIGWTFLFAFITFIAFITLLIGGASAIMGLVNKDRGWTIFGLKVLLITILAAAVFYALSLTFMKEIALHFNSIFK